MRILMLAQFYPPTVGGEEHHVQTLSVELAARGHQVAVATLWHQGLPDTETDHGVRIYRIRGTMQRAAWLFKDQGRTHAPPFPDPELTAALRRIVRAERPDIVHAHNWLLRSFLPLKSWSKAKLVATLHDYGLVCANQNYLYDDAPCTGPGAAKCLACASRHYGLLKGPATVLSNWAMSAAERASVDMFLTVSRAPAAGNRLAERKLPFQIVPNFLPDDFSPPDESTDELMSQLPGEDFLLFVGDLRRFKGVDVLLKAYAGLKDPPPLVLIGRECEDMPEHFPPNVHVLNRWPHAAVMRAWERSIMGLLPSVGPETFGMVVLEAMSRGRPVVASNIGGLPDVVADDETGLLVTPGHVDALRGAIEKLLGDPALRERMGQAARLRAAQFAASAVVPRIERIYQALLQDTTVPAPSEAAAQVGEKEELWS